MRRSHHYLFFFEKEAYFLLIISQVVIKQKEYVMKQMKIVLIAMIALLVVSSAGRACEFGWTTDFNTQAKADPAGFRERIAERFDLNDIQAIALRSIFSSPADAFIMLRFGEIKGVLSKLSKEQGIAAINKYRSNKGKGWFVLAEILGVESESKEFLALQHGHDLSGHNSRDHVPCSDFDDGNVKYAANDLGSGEKRQAGFKN
jgi:hypothetical protein